jgi:GSCFA family
MEFKLSFIAPALGEKIKHVQKVLLIGSCFTENIGRKMSERGIRNLQNPHGILFNPVSIWGCLRDITQNVTYENDHLFELHDAWHSWNHHSRFSGNTPQEALEKMNTSIQNAHQFLQQTDWLLLTLGSAFAYRHNDLDFHVSNNHRAPDQWFTKELLDVDFMVANLEKQITNARVLNPELKVIFTISPVRHLRDGLIDNNRSKARLIEVVHLLCASLPNCYYFPSYEIIIDELRDYRFYDIDFAHPNYLATEYVWTQFIQSCIDINDHALMDALYKINIALHHRTSNPEGKPHKAFLKLYLEQCRELQRKFSYLDLGKEMEYFNNNT